MQTWLQAGWEELAHFGRAVTVQKVVGSSLLLDCSTDGREEGRERREGASVAALPAPALPSFPSSVVAHHPPHSGRPCMALLEHESSTQGLGIAARTSRGEGKGGTGEVSAP